MTRLYLLNVLVLGTLTLLSPARLLAQQPVFHNSGEAWVDSIMSGLTLDEKIGQLFMVPAYSNKGAAHEASISKLISEYQVGGIIFMQGGPVRQAQLVNRFQEESKIPLLIAQDAEWGLGMRLDSTVSFPRQMMWGALQDFELVREFGRELGRQCTRVGVNINLAPVVDINNNSRNPVINDRSFGENRYNVALRGLQYAQGLQDKRVLACAKHFPGHGDTDKDSHHDLPVIKHSRLRLDSVELYPYKIMIPQRLGAVMTAHLNIPALDNTPNSAASISPKIVNGILRDELGFKGLVVTDALTMQGVSGFNTPGHAELKALLAGSDILLFPSSISKAKGLIKGALQDGTYSEEKLDRTVRRILHAKHWSGLSDFKSIQISGLHDDLNNLGVEALHRKLVADALTIVANNDTLLPIAETTGKQIAAVSIGGRGFNHFQESLKRYADIESFNVSKDGQLEFANLLTELKEHDITIVSLHGMSRYASRGFGVSLHSKYFIEQLCKQNKVILVVFGNPYSLQYFDYARNVVMAYEDTRITQELAGQLVFGAIGARGSLPVTASQNYRYGQGFINETSMRLQYGLPEDVGLSSDELRKIDLIAEEMLLKRAAPSANVLIAKDGQVIYHKAFGHHTYEKETPAQLDDIYDLASITKIAATTLSVMKLYEDGLLSIDSNFAAYIPELDGKAVGNIKIRDAMTHTAGLKAWIPFYEATTISDSIYRSIYTDSATADFGVQIAEDLYMRNDWVDTVWSKIGNSSLKRRGNYKYSDLGFYLLSKVVANISGSTMPAFVADNFYRPLGLRTTTFNPTEQFTATRLVPTEDDTYFRQQELRGHVHDMGAAMLGGVSGHAGLFSDANDLAILLQMLLNGGTYAGKRFLKESTIQYFTKRQNTRSRRGLGFDKPEPSPNKPGPTCKGASLQTYGHSGFTGTYAWVDPKHQLVYIFLSNRTYPTMDNRKLISENIRSRIHQVIYDAIQIGNHSNAPLVNVPMDGQNEASKP